ncbi:protein of unknown function [Pseudorhizobium banfieldiae]|uniref:Uncharacterized protein n=1 Tax=Pseudorhizobium banfieldiae TaxID=1125847 RepID=L0NG20_9HYPH|nr:protein of unknown function [Pseudorhizobium banfieldiae]
MRQGRNMATGPTAVKANLRAVYRLAREGAKPYFTSTALAATTGAHDHVQRHEPNPRRFRQVDDRRSRGGPGTAARGGNGLPGPGGALPQQHGCGQARGVRGGARNGGTGAR